MTKQSFLFVSVLGYAVALPNALPAQDRFQLWEDRLSFGGEIRTRGEWFDDFYTRNTPNTANGLSERDDEFLLLRTKLHLDFHPDETWRVFVEVQDSRQYESEFANRHAVPNAFQDNVDLFQGYVDINHILDSPVSLRIGRQILAYGKQRLVGGFLWSNVSRSFDAAKVTFDLPDFYGGKIDVFAGQPVDHDWGEFNDVLDNANEFYGAYSTWKEVFIAGFLDAYYLVRVNNDVDDEVHTLGTRLGHQYESGWDWEVELAGQLGEFTGLDHSAFASHIEVGYALDWPWKPHVSVAHNFATGDDDSTDGDHETFDNLFPTNHIHYGQMDLMSWRNGHDIELEASLKPHERLLAVSEVHFFILDEAEDDAWYNAGGAVLRTGVDGADSYAGTELDLRLQYNACKWFAVEGGYSHFFAGAYLNDTGDDEDADWAYLQATVTF